MNTYENDSELTLSYEDPLEPCPEGKHPLLCVDVVPVDPEEQTYDGVTKLYEKIVLVFQAFPIDEDSGKILRDTKGAVFQVERKFTKSLAPQAALRMALEKWRGRDYTPDELKSVSLAKLRGVPAWGTVIHNTRFVNIQDIEPYVDANKKSLSPPKAENYARRNYKKRAKAQTVTAPQSQPASPGGNINDPSSDKSDYVPF